MVLERDHRAVPSRLDSNKQLLLGRFCQYWKIIILTQRLLSPHLFGCPAKTKAMAPPQLLPGARPLSFPAHHTWLFLSAWLPELRLLLLCEWSVSPVHKVCSLNQEHWRPGVCRHLETHPSHTEAESFLKQEAQEVLELLNILAACSNYCSASSPDSPGS